MELASTIIIIVMGILVVAVNSVLLYQHHKDKK